MLQKRFYIILLSILIKFSIQEDKDKICFIFLHDESSSYDKNFMEAANDTCNELGVECTLKTNIPEDDTCYNTVEELAKDGCKGIFADSFGHESYILKGAQNYPNIQFGHATGTLAHTSNLSNYHNAFASIYEGRYATGIAAGMKLNQIINDGNLTASQAIVGYVGAFPYAEVISGYTAFYLGVKSVCDEAKMKVRYTYSWYDEEGEKEAAEKLIDEDECKIISQHADSLGAPNVCESKGVPNIFYNGENPTLNKSYLISSRINWRPYFKYFINCTLNNITMDPDWTGSLSDGSVEVYNASSLAVVGTQEAIDKAISDLKAGNLKVFDTSKFTVDGKTVTSYKADVDTDANYTGDTEAIKDGYFHESEYRSAPYFDLEIDGISFPEVDNTDSDTGSDSGNSTNTHHSTRYFSKKKGLSGGAIVAIVLPLAAAVLAVGGVIGYTTWGVSSAPKAPIENTATSLNHFVK